LLYQAAHGWPSGVGDVLVEAPVEAGRGQFAQIGEHQGEVGMVKGGEESETGALWRLRIDSCRVTVRAPF